MSADRRFLLTALVFALIGMGLGEYMGASGRHEQHVTHAHILLVGFVVSFIYAVIHRLWLSHVSPTWAWVHYTVHTLGAVLMSVGLWLMFSGTLAEAQVGPVLGLSGTLVILGAAMTLVKLWRTPCA